MFDWQAFAIEEMLGLGVDSRWVSSTDGLNVARQNGKGVILQAIEAFFAFELAYPVVMHTAHEFATSQEHQLRLEAMIQDAPHLHAQVKERGGYVHANGQESIRLKSGSRIIFKARTKGGGRGYSGDLLVWDEAMVIPDAVVGAQMPMLRASQSPHGRKVIYAGSAVDQLVHEHGVNFARLRERGIANAENVTWLEWSAPLENPDAVEEQLADRSLWPLANPSMADGLVSEETMADEIATMPARTAAVELLGIGDWPATSLAAQNVIDMEKWSVLEDRESTPLDPVCFAFDVSPKRTAASIVVAGRRDDGLLHVEVVDRRPGTGWVVDRLAELDQRHEPATIVCDNASPAASLLDDLERQGVRVETTSGTEYGRACGRFFDAVEDGELRHLGTSELRAALRGARQKRINETWGWSRSQSTVDITPLVACSLALWAAMREQPSVYESREAVSV